MKRWYTLVLALTVAAAAKASDEWTNWTIQSKPKDESQVSEIELHYLINENQRYRLVKFGAKNDTRFELIGVDQKSRTISLLANPFESIYAMQKPASMYRCKSIVEPQDRKNFYSICNSRFAAQRGEITEVDTEKLRQALDESGFLTVIAEAKLSQYRSDFTKATTAPALKRFIERYKNDDPEGLVSQARHKMPDQELEDYRAAFSRAMSTPMQEDKGLGDPGFFRKEALRRFVEAYRGRDPEHLAVKANGEFLKMLAEDERQRQRHFGTVGEMGTTVCLEVHTDPSLYLDEKHWRDAGFAQIVGTTEQATATKLKVYVHRIMAWKAHDIYQNGSMASLMVDGLKVSAGGYAWFDRHGWRACKAK